MNDINDEIKDTLAQLLKRTADDFGVTLSGNNISKETIDYLQKLAVEKHNIRIHSQNTDPNIQPQADPYIGLKRITF